MRGKIFKEFTYNKMDEIYSFVRNSLYDFDSMGVHKEKIRILMPDSVKYIMKHYYFRAVQYRTPEEQLKEARYCDIEVYPHYKNEIVVYCTEFDSHKELDQPKILEL